MKKGFCLFLVCLLCLTALTGCGSVIRYQYEDAGHYTAGNGDAAVDEVTEIEIDWTVGSVTVELYEGEKIQFSDNSSFPKDENLLHSYLDGTTLKIRFRESTSFRLGNMEPKDLEVLVPATAADCIRELSVAAQSAEVFIRGLQMEMLEVETVSGGITVDAEAENITVDTVSGPVALSGTFGDVKIDTVSGDASVLGVRCPEKLEGNSTSGNFRVTLPLLSDFACTFHTVSGSFDGSDFSERRVAEETVYTVGNGENKLEFETVSGDLYLTKQ